MAYVFLTLALFAGLLGFLFTWRFLLFAVRKATFSTMWAVYRYAFGGAVLLAGSAWLFGMAVPGMVA